jgi:hypothetical protein
MTTESSRPRDVIAEGEKADEQVTGADSGPVDEQDMAAADGLQVSEVQAQHYQEMLERGAHQQGEGATP